MKISLIGMSGAGKTHWSQLFATQGFKHYSCNDIIEKKLGDELRQSGYSGIRDVAKWLGEPYEKNYQEKSARFLQVERESLLELLDNLKNVENENSIIDTTGSVIYTGEDVLNRLKKETLVILLDTPNEVKEEMYNLYIEDPKPVIWGDLFFRFRGESYHEALSRCYDDLLEYRLKKYKQMAHTKISYYQLRSQRFSLTEFLQYIAALAEQHKSNKFEFLQP